MKKIVAILLIVIYGSTSVGATIHIHYCMNEFVGWRLWHSDKKNECSKCGMKEQKGGCCKDEHKQVKLITDQNANPLKLIEFKQFSTPKIFSNYSGYNFTKAYFATNTSFLKNNAPPNRWRSVPLFLSNCMFLI